MAAQGIAVGQHISPDLAFEFLSAHDPWACPHQGGQQFQRDWRQGKLASGPAHDERPGVEYQIAGRKCFRIQSALVAADPGLKGPGDLPPYTTRDVRWA